jgi:hypothetical protein
VLPWLTAVLYLSCGILAALAAWGIVRDAVLDDRMLAALTVMELALIGQAAAGLAQGLNRPGGWEKAVFFAYALSVPFVPPLAAYLALKEKTRWGMGVLLLASGVVAVFVVRLAQIWGSGGSP